MIQTDLHTHTVFSFDGQGNFEQLCEGAIENGIAVLASTEHFDLSPQGGDAYFIEHNERRKAALAKAQQRYAGKVQLLAGVELGQPHVNLPVAKKLLQENQFDLVLASVHNLADGRDVYGIDYVEDGQCREIITLFLEEMIKMAQVADFDVLGHIDFPIRNMGKVYTQYTMRPYEEPVRELLKILAQREKALEVNTRGMRCWQHCICPEDWILSAFRQYSGKYLAVGSDSHSAPFVGTGAKEAYDAVKRAGFDQVVYYEKRQPIALFL